MKAVTQLSLATLLALAGCNLFRRDLISEGVYGLETAGVVGCEVAATAVVREGDLRLDGFIRGMRLTAPAEGEVEIRLRSPDGNEKTADRVPIRLVYHRRTSHSHPRFEALIDEVPPPGTEIIVVPKFPLCPPAVPSQFGKGTGQGNEQQELEGQ